MSLPRLPNTPFGSRDQWITDADGRVFIVHGVNMINKLPPYTLSATGFGVGDAKLLASKGINAVRVGVIYSAVEPAPGEYDYAYLEDIRGTVKILADEGIMSLIDFHQDGWGPVFIGEGFPEWATLTDGLPIRPMQTFPALWDNPAVMRTWGNFWRNNMGPGGGGLVVTPPTPLQDRFAAAWAQAVKILKDSEGILGWELLNEPWPGDIWDWDTKNPEQVDQAAQALTDFTNRVVRAIRNVDMDHMIWYEPFVTFDWGAPAWINPITDPAERIGMAFHNYMDVTKPGEYEKVWANAREHYDKTKNPLLCTEFGGVLGPSGTEAGAPSGATVITQEWDSVDGQMLPAIYWTYWNRTPYQIANPETGKLISSAAMGMVYDPHLSLADYPDNSNIWFAGLMALARTYPVFVAGTPVRWSFDSETARFELVFDPLPTATGSDLTEIFVPADQYPNGAVVSVTGGAEKQSQDSESVVVRNIGTERTTVIITR